MGYDRMGNLLYDRTLGTPLQPWWLKGGSMMIIIIIKFTQQIFFHISLCLSFFFFFLFLVGMFTVGRATVERILSARGFPVVFSSSSSLTSYPFVFTSDSRGDPTRIYLPQKPHTLSINKNN